MTPSSLATLLEDLEWQTRAACRDLDSSYWFADTGHKGTTRSEAAMKRAAIATCQSCQVRQPCLDYAMSTNQLFGIWGALTVRQRRALRRGAA